MTFNKNFLTNNIKVEAKINENKYESELNSEKSGSSGIGFGDSFINES